MIRTMKPHLILVLAVLIAPAYPTSKAYVSKKMWTSSGCTGDMVKDKYDDFFADGTCIPESKSTASRRRTAITDTYRKVLCTANTATTGYTRTEYTDSACTTGASQTASGSTDTCFGAGSEYETYTCTTTSATVGAVEYRTYSVDGCADAELAGAGFFLVNYCVRDEEDGTWSESWKYVIEGGKLQKYEWKNWANADCSGTGTAVTDRRFTTDSCNTFGTEFIKISALIDGADIDGYSTLNGAPTSAPTTASGNSSEVKAVLNPITVLLVGLFLSLGFK